MFPLKKSKITFNSTDTNHLIFNDFAEIPMCSHPGSFGSLRMNHVHEGVDIYCNNGDEVFSMEAGEIVKIIPFTGEIAQSPWWNNTYAVIIKHKNFYMNYGEILPADDLFVGQKIDEGYHLGYVTTVLKKDKGRPMNMLHLEMYDLKTPCENLPAKSWDLGEPKPIGLINPTFYLSRYII